MGDKHIITDNASEELELFKGQSEVHKYLFAYADTLVLRSAVELQIADIIHAHGQPMTLTQIASNIKSPTPSSLNVSRLARVMQMLVRKKIFTIDCEHEPKYGLTPTSKWLLHDHELSLAPMFLTFTDPSIVNAWFHISPSITLGGENAFVKAHGETFWDKTSNNPEFNKMAKIGMAAASQPILEAVIKGYAQCFNDLKGTLVDVGGGVGNLVAKVVESYPHIKGINFDLPNVVGDAPMYPGVTHIGGDMFKKIPDGHNVIIKSVLHNWGDKDCLTILENCKKAISEKRGKVIIVDVVLNPCGDAMADDAAIALDLWLMASSDAGIERTENEWKKLLKEAGFTNLNIVPIQVVMPLAIIEATY